MGIISRFKQAQDYRRNRAVGKPTYKVYDAVSQRVQNASHMKFKVPRNSPQYYVARGVIRRGVGTVFPSARPMPRRQGRVKPGGGRGRPRGSFKYYIPGKGPVSVFEWRRYIRMQRNQLSSEIQRQLALQRGGRYIPQQSYRPVPQMPQQYYPQQQPIPVVQPSLKEISVLERTPLTFASTTDNSNQFVEQNMFSGKPQVRQKGVLW